MEVGVRDLEVVRAVEIWLEMAFCEDMVCKEEIDG